MTTVSNSKIPIASRRLSTSSNSGGVSPESALRNPAPVSSSKFERKERPQSIDIEDEFKNKLQYGRLIASFQQSPTSPPNQNSKNGLGSGRDGAIVSPSSRIPVLSRSRETSPVKENAASPKNNHSTRSSTSPVRSKIPLPKGETDASPRRAYNRPAHDAGPGSPDKWSSTSSTNSSSPSYKRDSRSKQQATSDGDTSETEELIPIDSGDVDMEAKRKRGKKSEAFVMTGDRIIGMAKTPVTAEFKSKKRAPSDSHHSPAFLMDDIDEPSKEAAIQSSTLTETSSVKLREQPVLKRPFVRSSKSEDQLLMADLPPELEDTASGSVHTLLDTSTSAEAVGASQSPFATMTMTTSSSTSKSASRKASVKRQTSVESKSSPDSKRRHSPDFSTSSLISSEHYNGESLLDQDNLSPTMSSSPDTPEWSLLDSFHKKSNGDTPQFTRERDAVATKASRDNPTTSEKSTEDELAETPTISVDEAITSCGNRVIITISSSNPNLTDPDFNLPNDNDNVDDETPQSSSTTAHQQAKITKDTPSNQPVQNKNNSTAQEKPASVPEAVPVYNQQPPSLATESSEESDLESLASLHSYHPPTKVIDLPSAVRLAKRLYNLDGFKRTDVSRHLGKINDFNQVVAVEYLRNFDFSGDLPLDAALKIFLSQLCLTGETQERERVLLHFSRRYLECNPDFVQHPTKQLYRSMDAVHTLTCAIMLLNTDLHGDNVGMQRKMTCNEFIENLSELNDGLNFPRDHLRAIYYRIKEEPMPWAASTEDESLQQLVGGVEDFEAREREDVPLSPASDSGGNVTRVVAALADAPSTQPVVVAQQNATSRLPPSDNRTTPATAPQQDLAAGLSIGKTAGGINPFLTLPDPSTAVEYKKGYVMRKCCIDPSGKKTKLGKRSWRMFFVTLRDMVLFCFKDEKSAVRQPEAFEDLSAAVRIHHGLAVRASDYSKKQFVFRLVFNDLT